jgi:6-phosphogluconolactonase (cycloisomerase 2 family)
VTSRDHSSFRISRRRAIAVVGVTAALAAVPDLALAAPAPSKPPTTGHLYVNLNASQANLVAGFARNADGTLTPLAGSPFSVGGTGTGAGLGSQGSIQLAHGGRYLLVADAGSNQISVLSVGSDGTLQPVAGSPFSSGGTNPVSIAVFNNTVFVANQGNGGSNYTGFILTGSGSLKPQSGSSWSLPDGSGVGQVLFDSTGTHLAGARVATSLIDSFVVGNDGALTAAPGSPYAAPIAGPLGSAFRAASPTELYVSLAHGGALAGAVGAYTVASNGSLAPIGASPFADFQTAACWLTLSPDQKYVFTANAGSGSISSYAVNSDGSLTLNSTLALRGGSGIGTFDLAFDPTGAYLYVVDGNVPQISILSVSGGTMTEITGSPVSLPSTPPAFGIAIK